MTLTNLGDWSLSSVLSKASSLDVASNVALPPDIPATEPTQLGPTSILANTESWSPISLSTPQISLSVPAWPTLDPQSALLLTSGMTAPTIASSETSLPNGIFGQVSPSADLPLSAFSTAASAPAADLPSADTSSPAALNVAAISLPSAQLPSNVDTGYLPVVLSTQPSPLIAVPGTSGVPPVDGISSPSVPTPTTGLSTPTDVLQVEVPTLTAASLGEASAPPASLIIDTSTPSLPGDIANAGPSSQLIFPSPTGAASAQALDSSILTLSWIDAAGVDPSLNALSPFPTDRLPSLSTAIPQLSSDNAPSSPGILSVDTQAPSLSVPSASLSALSTPAVSPSAPEIPSFAAQQSLASRPSTPIPPPTTIDLPATPTLSTFGALPTVPPPPVQAPTLAAGTTILSAPDASAPPPPLPTPSMPSIGSIAAALDEIGGDLVLSLAGAMVQLMNLLSAAGQPPPAAPPAATGVVDGVASAPSSGIVQTAPSPLDSRNTDLLATTTAPSTPTSLDSVLTSHAEASSTFTVRDPDPNKRKRALPAPPRLQLPPALAPIPIVPGLAGVQTPTTTAVAALGLQPSPSIGGPATFLTSTGILPSVAVPSLPAASLPSVPSVSPPGSSTATDAALPAASPISAPSIPASEELPSVPSLPAAPALPSAKLLPSQYYEAVNNAPVIGSATLPVAAGSAVLSVVSLPFPSLPSHSAPQTQPLQQTTTHRLTPSTHQATTLPLPPYLPTLLQTAKNAATANLTALPLPLLARVDPLLAIVRLLAMLNIGQFGSLETLTSLPAAQAAVAVLNTPDLITVAGVLERREIVYSTAADGLLGDVVGFVRVVEGLVPVVRDLRGAVAYVVLEQLGFVGVGEVVDWVGVGGV